VYKYVTGKSLVEIIIRSLGIGYFTKLILVCTIECNTVESQFTRQVTMTIHLGTTL